MWLLVYMGQHAKWFDCPSIPNLTLDPKDDHIGSLALYSRAQYLVTLDKDFAPMKRRGYTVKVVSPYDFLQVLRASS